MVANGEKQPKELTRLVQRVRARVPRIIADYQSGILTRGDALHMLRTVQRAFEAVVSDLSEDHGYGVLEAGINAVIEELRPARELIDRVPTDSPEVQRLIGVARMLRLVAEGVVDAAWNLDHFTTFASGTTAYISRRVAKTVLLQAESGIIDIGDLEHLVERVHWLGQSLLESPPVADPAALNIQALLRLLSWLKREADIFLSEVMNQRTVEMPPAARPLTIRRRIPPPPPLPRLPVQVKRR